ncbi:MAG: TIR domain-containing protein [Deltaproteobacteria bacterium]|nr:TIR domain-containing protein [Deltaproteobacteria bacterium]
MKLFFSRVDQDRTFVDSIQNCMQADVLTDDAIVVAGQDLEVALQDAILCEVDYFVVFLCEEAIKSKWVMQELDWAFERQSKSSPDFIIPILIRDDATCIPEKLAKRRYLRNLGHSEADARRIAAELESDLLMRLAKIFDEKKSLRRASADTESEQDANDSQNRTDGVVDPAEVHDSTIRLQNEEFAIELLTRDVVITRDRCNGPVTVTIDRRDVKEMVISNDGVRAVIQRCISSSNTSVLSKLDASVQSFLTDPTKTGERRIGLPTSGVPLRWASGGILSIVKFAEGGPEGRWVPVFFRDIRPYGWNISLGKSERWFTKDDRIVPGFAITELNDPWQLILREFLEESLVVNGHPLRDDEVRQRRFLVKKTDGSIARARADEFDEEHLRLRLDEDNLTIVKPSVDLINDPDAITAKTRKISCSIHIKSDSNAIFTTNNVLVCFSLLDLGIEVVKVVTYKIRAEDYMLDGEIRVHGCPGTNATKRELVRMPVALICLDYLKEMFGSSDQTRCYTYGAQPSIRAQRPPVYGKEIKIFDWDVRRRMEFVEGEPGDWQRERFPEWYDKFGRHFVKERANPGDNWDTCFEDLSQLFVPATAKILNTYFNMR